MSSNMIYPKQAICNQLISLKLKSKDRYPITIILIKNTQFFHSLSSSSANLLVKYRMVRLLLSISVECCCLFLIFSFIFIIRFSRCFISSFCTDLFISYCSRSSRILCPTTNIGQACGNSSINSLRFVSACWYGPN